MGKLFKGIIPALCTPFDEQGELATHRAQPLVRSLLEANVSGFFVCGATGEGKSMTVTERKQMAEVVIREVAGAVPVMIHVGGTSTVNAVELAKHAETLGADAVGSMAPIDAPKDLQAAVAHYGAIGAAIDLPFYVYWVAETADQRVEAEQFLDAMQPVKNFTGIKFTDTNFYRFQRLVDCSGGNLNALTGPDEMCLAGLVMGSDGAIGSTYNIMPRLVIGMHTAFLRGDIKQAMAAQAKMNRVIALLMKAGVLAGLKAILGWRGLRVGAPRPPVSPSTAERLEELWRSIRALDFEVA
jgi:N-acetylneuraminate lyase